MLDRRLLLFALMALSACASAPPPALPSFRLAPAAYGQRLQLAQRLTVLELQTQDAPSERQLDAVLDLNDERLQLVALALGQRVLSLRWDGVELKQQRHALLPAVVDGERVLRDIALAYGPLPALRVLLPAGWDLQEQAGERTLLQAGALRLRVQFIDARIEIDNRAERYRLRIESRPLEDSAP